LSQPDTQTLTATSETGEIFNFTGEATEGYRVRGDSIHLSYDLDDSYDEINITAVPKTKDTTTYYSMLNWNGSYAGIQFADEDRDVVIFSTWDTNDENATIIDSGDSNLQYDFGGEGTGVSVRLVLPPSEYGAIEGLPDDYRLSVDHEYTLNMKASYPDDADCEDTNMTKCTDYTIEFYDKL